MFPVVVFTLYLALYFDGSHNKQAQKAGAGYIITDDSGELVVAAAYNLGIDVSWCDEATAEVIGLRNGLQLAKERNVKLSAIKVDNQSVIDLVRGQVRRQHQPLTGIIAEIKRDLGFASLQRIDRSANKVAVNLASMGSLLVTRNRIFTKYDVPPSQILELINKEKVRNADGEEDNRLAIAICTVGLVAAGAAALLRALWRALWRAISLASTLMRSLNNAHYYTLEYFGSDRNQKHKATAGCIIRNERKFVVAAAYNLDSTYPGGNVSIADAIALLNGLKLADANSVQLDLIKGRNPDVRKLVLGEMTEAWSFALNDVIKKIMFLLRKLGIKPTDHNLKHVDKDTIKVAKELAYKGRFLGEKAEIYYRLEDLPPKAAEYFNAAFA